MLGSSLNYWYLINSYKFKYQYYLLINGLKEYTNTTCRSLINCTYEQCRNNTQNIHNIYNTPRNYDDIYNNGTYNTHTNNIGTISIISNDKCSLTETGFVDRTDDPLKYQAYSLYLYFCYDSSFMLYCYINRYIY